MRFDYLLQHRDELRRIARLANLVYAYQWLGNFSERIARSGLTGLVVMRGPNVHANRHQAVFLAQDFSQSVVDEHFLPEEITELHGVLSIVHDTGLILEMRFRLEDIGDVYLPALRCALVVADVDVLPKKQPFTVEGPNLDAA